MIKWVLLLLFPILSYTQNDRPFITTYTSQHGIPPLKISEIAKDSAGYLWLGSNIGLHRFDGKNFRTFTNLPRSVVTDIQVNSEGKVIVAIADNGIGIYNDYTEEFDFYLEPEIFENRYGFSFKIAFGKDDEIYIILNGYGLLSFDIEKGEYKSLIKKHFFKNILALRSDPNRLIIAGDSIYTYHISNDSLSLLSPYNPYHITIDSEDNLWINEDVFNGFMKINTKSGEETYFEDRHDNLTYFMNHSNGAIWSETKNELIKFDINSGKWDYYETGTGEISGLLVEENGRVWFGQDNKLNVIEPQNQLFTAIPGSEDDLYTAASEIEPGKIAFLSFSSDELHIYDSKSRKFQVDDKFNTNKLLNFPFGMVKIGNELWVSFFNGIARYGIDNGRFEEVTFSRYNDYFDRNNKMRLYKDASNNLWINSLNNPILFRVNVKTLEIDSVHYKIIGEAYEDGIKVNQKGEIKYASDIGLVEIDFDSGQQKIFHYFQNDKELDFGFIDAFHEQKGEIWIITNTGTYIGKQQKEGIQITEKLDSGQEFSYSENLDIMLGYKNLNIILTSAGIKVINKEKNQFRFWGINEGLRNLNKNSEFLQANNYLFFLGKGLLYVDQQKLFSKKETPHVAIRSLKVNEVRVDDQVLHPDQNDINIKFESIDLTKPLDVQYKYRLSPDNPWIYKDYQENEVYFLDLKPGKYRFEVSAKHKNTEWSKAVYRDFEINRPFWRKWWFLLSVLLFISFMIYLYYRWRLAKVEEVSRLKTRMMELENKALRAQMNPHFIFNSLNSIKSFIIDNEKEDAADYLTSFSDLIRLILANSRERLIPLEKELSALELYMDIENIRLDQKFTYAINNEVLDTYIQPLTLQPFIENAIWHGFIHKKGRGELLITIKRNNNEVIIEIADDGVGRKKSQIIEKKHNRKRSFGILITKERLSRSEIDNDIEIEDLVNEKGEPTGTKVRIVIPYQKIKL